MTSSGAGFARVDGRAEHDCSTLVLQPNEVSPAVTASGAAFARTGQHGTEVDALVVQPNDVSSTLCASGAGTDRPSAQGSQEGFCVVSMKTDNTKANGTYISDAPVSYTLDTLAPPAVFPLDLRHLLRDDASFGGLGLPNEPVGSLTCGMTGGGNPPAMAPSSPPLYPRRLTPLECERLMGFPDGWTNVRFQGKPARDTLRYRALGNSMAVPVMRWLAEGIREFF
jgi:site-specific DNA-cytosine methylase